MDDIANTTHKVITTVLHQGWCWLPADFGVEPSTLAAAIGPVLPSSAGDKSKLLRPLDSTEAPQKSMSATVGLGPQPFHTDGAWHSTPPRYLVLHCEDAGEGDCPTLVRPLDWTSLSVSSVTELKRPGWIVRGGGLRRPFYSQILTTAENRRYIRFDPYCMSSPRGNSDAVGKATSLLLSHSLSKQFQWREKDTLVLDNWRCLHARGFGATLSKGRRLRRWTIGGHHGVDSRSALREGPPVH